MLTISSPPPAQRLDLLQRLAELDDPRDPERALFRRAARRSAANAVEFRNALRRGDAARAELDARVFAFLSTGGALPNLNRDVLLRSARAVLAAGGES